MEASYFSICTPRVSIPQALRAFLVLTMHKPQQVLKLYSATSLKNLMLDNSTIACELEANDCARLGRYIVIKRGTICGIPSSTPISLA